MPFRPNSPRQSSSSFLEPWRKFPLFSFIVTGEWNTRIETTNLSLVMNFDLDLFGLIGDDIEWPVLQVGLDCWVVIVSSNQTLCIEDCILWVCGHLGLGGLADETMSVCECDDGRSCSVSLFIRYNFYMAVFPYSNTRISIKNRLVMPTRSCADVFTQLVDKITYVVPRSIPILGARKGKMKTGLFIDYPYEYWELLFQTSINEQIKAGGWENCVWRNFVFFNLLLTNSRKKIGMDST